MSRATGILAAALLIAACGDTAPPASAIEDSIAQTAEYYGTLEPFASEAVYFIVTDRFVDGDPTNNHEDQGGDTFGTFDIPIQHPDGGSGNIGYLGGDFRGVLDNAAYISDMGFSAIWLTPVVDQPDEAFSGGKTIAESAFPDRGKTGYHGYWGVNFFAVDEHLPSEGLDFGSFVSELRQAHGLKFVLDAVCNHGSPSFTMPIDQPKYGEIYNADGELIADHQNLHPGELDLDNPLHRFFHREPDLNELSNLNDLNPEVLDYFVDAYLYWIDQGVAALRIDTIKHMPHAYWKAFTDRVRERHPGFFMFGEHWDNKAESYAPHTWAENGSLSVLDFAGKEAMQEVFARGTAGFEGLSGYLHLTDGLFQNPYDLMTFYDNHDMPRMDADVDGFQDANHWLFTSRGIPVLYYGSEIGFRAGAAEHAGNRDYFGQDNVERARSHPLRASLSRIVNIRQSSVALQRGLQANLELSGDTAQFYRVYQHDGVNQTALVLLNKGDDPTSITVDRWLSPGRWRDADGGETVVVDETQASLTTLVPAHGAKVWFLDDVNRSSELSVVLAELQSGARARR